MLTTCLLPAWLRLRSGALRFRQRRRDSLHLRREYRPASLSSDLRYPRESLLTSVASLNSMSCRPPHVAPRDCGYWLMLDSGNGSYSSDVAAKHLAAAK